MISVSEATKAILSNLHRPGIERTEIEHAVGRVLAEDVYADRDFPPFDRVTMDGIAINFETWKNGSKDYFIEKTQAAGEAPSKLTAPENAIEVMTGAVLPNGTDTVIRYEDLTIRGKLATINAAIEKGQSIHRKGNDARKNDSLLEPKIKISPAEVALLASVGKAHVDVYKLPKAAIIGSGDELVPVSTVPEPHQIRRSNTYAIQSAMLAFGWTAHQHHLPDDPAILTDRLGRLLDENDVLILSGGVSKGKFDYLPGIFQKLGVTEVFHQVSQRPGKPMWFGVKNGKTVFALPGNPVSTYMCLYKYVMPWLNASLGLQQKPSFAVLAEDFSFSPRLTYFLQVRVENEYGRLVAYAEQGGGSGDFANLKKIDGFLELPEEKTEFKRGEVFPYIPFRL